MRLLLSPLNLNLSDPARRYGFAGATVAAAFLLREALDPVLDKQSPFLAFVLPVLLSAVMAGTGPGLLAMLLSIAAGTFAFIHPATSWAVTSAADLTTIALFAANGGAIVWLADRLTRTRQRARHGTQAVAASEERFRLLVEDVRDYAIYMLDPDGRIVSWNTGAERLKGWQADEVLGQNVSIFHPPEARDQGRPQEELRYAREQGVFREEARRIRKDGSEFIADITLTALYDEQGCLRGYAKVTRDVTERKQAEVALRESEALKSAILQSALDCVVTIDNESRVVEWNPAAERTFGYEKGTILGELMAEHIIPGEYREKHYQGLAHYLATGEGPLLGKRIEVEAMRADGSRFPAELAITATQVRDKPHFTAHLRDITERKRATDALLELTATLERRVEERTRALEEVNQELKAFSYTVSHDLRAPLRAMEGFADILLHDFADKLGEDGQRYAKRIADAATRMDDLIEDLLAYSRLTSSDLHLQRVELAALVEKAAAELYEAPECATAQLEIRPPFPPVRAHPTVLRQIVSNLLSNAVKFVPKGRNPDIKVWSEARDDVVRLWIEDNGIGIALEHQSEIFDVFQRLHAPGAYPGTGIGLAIVRRGVERMNGESGVISELGKGSRFWIELPKAEEQA
jgi:PAS domain S-box-containing protein